MRYLVLIILAVLIFNFALVQAAEQSFIAPLQDVYLKYEQIGWQTYEFSAITNLENPQNLDYEWNIDNKEIYNSETLSYFFRKGEHFVKLKIKDQFGNVKYDDLRLSVHFWSLQNNWFWWGLYLLVVALIIYYWIIKVIYLINKHRISQQARNFLKILDEHGWMERIIENFASKHHLGK